METILSLVLGVVFLICIGCFQNQYEATTKERIENQHGGIKEVTITAIFPIHGTMTRHSGYSVSSRGKVSNHYSYKDGVVDKEFWLSVDYNDGTSESVSVKQSSPKFKVYDRYISPSEMKEALRDRSAF